jgi:DNA-binding transcriptional MerR regulator
MEENKYLIVRVKKSTGSSAYLSMTEVAYRCGVHPDLIDRFVRLGLIDFAESDTDGEALFQSDVISMVRKILRLRNELGVNYAGIGVILELTSRIEVLERHILELESKIFGGDSSRR